MAETFTTLTASEHHGFQRDGYVVVRQAFAPADALAIQQHWWDELAALYAIRRDDPATWRAIPSDLKAAKKHPLQARILSDRVHGVLDDLLGAGSWSRPKDWGRTIVTFPQPGPWDVPTGFWHWDNPCASHLDRPRGLFIVAFISAVAPRGGGTLLLSGSPRLLVQQHRRLSAEQQREPKPWLRFHASHPWLAALTGREPSPQDRVAAFMQDETLVDGIPLRVVELTGEPGDMVFCHPLMVHCGAPNRGERPRFMRIKQQFLQSRGGRP